MKKIIIFAIIVLIATIIYLFIQKKDSKQLTLTKEEMNLINLLSKENQDYFYQNKQLYSLFKEKYFKSENLEEYINLYKNDTSLSFTNIIIFVNYGVQNQDKKQVLQFLENKNTKPENIKRYLAYQENNSSLSIDQIVTLVNKDIDTITMEYHDAMEEFLDATYFIKENLERYLHYQEKYNTDINTTIAYVNSNLDYDYYTNTQNSNLEKDHLMIVNKYYALDSNYVPNNLVTIDSKYGRTLQMEQQAYEAFKQMADDAKKENLTLYIQSPYRSFQTQDRLYRNYTNQDGKELADTYSARPGFSEHQTGLAADIVNGAGKTLASFENTKEFLWMQENAHKYGFILRYQKGKEKITGYQYEPWHYRYVGIEVASKIKELGITFEEYYAYYIQ